MSYRDILKSFAALHGIILSERHLHQFMRMRTGSRTNYDFVCTIYLKQGNKLVNSPQDFTFFPPCMSFVGLHKKQDVQNVQIKPGAKSIIKPKVIL